MVRGDRNNKVNTWKARKKDGNKNKRTETETVYKL